MANDKKFNAVDTIQHRYSQPEILKQELLSLFNEKQIKWQVCRDLDSRPLRCISLKLHDLDVDLPRLGMREHDQNVTEAVLTWALLPVTRPQNGPDTNWTFRGR